MSHCHHRRQTAFIGLIAAVMLVGLTTGAGAGITVDVADSRAHFEQFLQQQENLSPAGARRLVGHIEHTTRSRVIDKWELPHGTILDYFEVGKQPDGPEASYTGSAVMVTRNSKMGRAYTRYEYSKLSFIERVNKWLGDIFAPRSHYVLVPVGLLGPGQTTQMVSAMTGQTTRRIGIVAAEFPPWDDNAPKQDTHLRTWPRGTHTATSDARYYSAYELVQPGVTLTTLSQERVRAFPMLNNLDVDFSGDVTTLPYHPDEPPDWFADSPGGPIGNFSESRFAPVGLSNPTWDSPGIPELDEMPATATWWSPEVSHQKWTEDQLRNAWHDKLFDRNNPLSLTNFYYANSHGKITIEGEHSSIIGWVKSNHVLNRHAPDHGPNHLYAIAPGTPLIRPFYVQSGHPQFDQRIVRASLDENGLTILFADDANPGNPDIFAWVADYDGVTTGDQNGYVRLYPASGASWSDYYYRDRYDSRRHHWRNPGGSAWRFQRSASGSPGYTYVNFDAASESAGSTFYLTVAAGGTTYRWGPRNINPSALSGRPSPPVPSGWAGAYPGDPADIGSGFWNGAWSSVYRAIRRGAELQNTTYTTEDVYATSADHTAAWRVYEGTADPVPQQRLFGHGVADPAGRDYGFGNRLKTFWYYHHNAPSSVSGIQPYQLAHVRNSAGYVDDIGGVVENSLDRRLRPYPFDASPQDGRNQGFNFGQPGGAGHNADRMVADINRVLVDNGIDLAALNYDRVAYIIPHGGIPEQHDTSMAMVPRFSTGGEGSGPYVLLPENSPLTLTAHEFGHGLFAFVDVYDQDFYNNFATLIRPTPPFKESLGLGPYSLMTRNCGGVRVDAWHKIGAGWADPVVMTDDRLNIEVPQIESTLRDPVILKLPANPYYILEGTPPAAWQEYYLVENRNRRGADYFGDPSPEGLYIYHVDARNIHHVPRPAGYTFQVDEQALSVGMVQADGRRELERYALNHSSIPNGEAPPAMSVVADGDAYPGGDPDAGQPILRRFSQLPQLLQQSDSDVGGGNRYAPRAYSHGDIITPADGTIRIKPETSTDSFSRVVNISDPGQSMTADVFVKPREIIATNVSTDPAIAPTLADGDDVIQGDRKVGMLAIRLWNPEYNGVDFQYMSTGEVTVDEFHILESGTADQPAGGDHPIVERAYLYAETNGVPGLQTDGANPDSLIGTTQLGAETSLEFGRSRNYSIFRNLGFRVPLTEERIVYVAYDIREDAQVTPSLTVGAELTDYTHIIPKAPGAVQVRARLGAKFAFGAHRFPLVGTTSLVINRPDELEVYPNPPREADGSGGAGSVAPPTISAGATDLPMLQLRLRATDDQVIIRRMTVHSEGEPLNVLRLYADQNRNGLVDPGEPLLASGNFAHLGGGIYEAVLSLEDLNPIALRTIQAGIDTYWLLAVDVAAEATTGGTVEIRIENSADIELVQNPAHPPASQDVVSELNFTVDEEGNPLPGATPAERTLVKSGISTITPPNAPPNPPVSGWIPPDGGSVSSTTPTFGWDPATDNPTDPLDPDTADDPDDLYYIFELATDQEMINLIWSGSTAKGVTTITLPDTDALPPLDDDEDPRPYYWRVRTVDTMVAWSPPSVTLQFFLSRNRAPEPPVLIYPIGGLEITSRTPTYRWSHATDPDPNDTYDTLRYRIQVADNPAFSNPIVNQDNITPPPGALLTDPILFPHVGPNLVVGVTYHWRVLTRDRQETESAWSTVQTFKVVDNRAPYAPIAPFVPRDADGVREVQTKWPTISWNTAAPPDPDESDTLDTIRYYVDVYEYPADGAPDPDADVLVESLQAQLTADEVGEGQRVVSATLNVRLNDNSQYWYRVRARDHNGTGLWSDWGPIQVFWVNTQNDPPEAPKSGFSPNNGMVVSQQRPWMSWHHATDPDPFDDHTTLRYIVQFSKVGTSHADFEAALAYQYSTGQGENSVRPDEALQDDTTWFWRVRTVDPAGEQSPWSDIQFFQVDTDNQPPVLSDGQVIPSHGTKAQFYEYRVTYSDPEGDAPGWVQVTIDPGTAAEQVLPMVAVEPPSPTTADFRDGVVYSVGIAGANLDWGLHTWVFSTQNGARLPELPADPADPAEEGLGPTLGVPATVRLTDDGWADANEYEESGEVHAEVEDPDEAGQGTVTVTFMTFTDDTMTQVSAVVEGVVLNETAPGIFRGSIQLYGGPAPAPAGQLHVIAGSDGTPIGVYYIDKDDVGNPTIPEDERDQHLVTARAVDTEPPSAINQASPKQPNPALLADSGVHGRSADLDWTAYDEAVELDVAGYRVYYSDQQFFNTDDAGVQMFGTTDAGEQETTVTGLQPDTDYYFAVVPFDEVPNPAPAASVPVTTTQATTADTAPPVISNLVPADGATEVPLDTTISFQVRDEGVGLDLDAAGNLDVVVTVGGTPVDAQIAPTETPDFWLVQVQPDQPFNWNDQVEVAVTVRDLAGNQTVLADTLAAPPWNFNVLADTTDPDVTSMSPDDGDTGVAVDAAITFHLTDDKSGVDIAIADGKIDAANSRVTVLFDGQDVTGQVDASLVNGTLDVACSYSPAGGMQYNDSHQVRVTVFDVADNSTVRTWNFDLARDETLPFFDQFEPGRNATDVPVDTNISVRVTDTHSGVAEGSIRMWVTVGDGAETEVTAAVETTPDGNSVVVTYDPPSHLPHDTDIHVRVYARDTVGVEGETTWQFRTVEPTTFVIGGNIVDGEGNPVPNVTVTINGRTVTTDGNGAYLMSGFLAGTYTVTPTKEEWSFSPTSEPVTVDPDDKTNVNFTGTLITYSVSGRVFDRDGQGVAGVAIAWAGGSVTTVEDGSYTIPALRRGQYTLTPSLQYHHFDPVNRPVNVVDADVTGRDFLAIPDTFTISGTVLDASGRALQGVEVSYAGGSAVTDAEGRYALSNVAMGTHTLSATKAGYRILPATLQVEVPPDATDADFTGYSQVSNSFPAGVSMVAVPGTPVTVPGTGLNDNPVNVFGTNNVVRWDPAASPPGYLRAADWGATDFMRVRPGVGFFVRYAAATTLGIAAQPTDPTRTVSVGLGVGWNMIGNPFANPTAVGNFRPTITDGVRPYAFVYNNATGSYELVSSRPAIHAVRSSLQPWEGAWMLCVAGGTSLNITAGATTAAAAGPPEDVDTAGGYVLPIVATANGRADTSSVAGVVPGAGAEHTLPNPPTAPATVDVYFVGSDGKMLARDIRDDTGAAQTYDFVVSCGVGPADVAVSLPDLSSVPHRYEVMLTDVAADKTTYARTMPAYTYRATEADSLRHFRLEVRPRTVASLTVSPATAVQEGDGAVVSYSVSQSCHVTITVRNIAGRTVKVLAADQVVSAGLNSQVWNLRSDTGAKVPAGTYLVEIQAMAGDGQQARGLSRLNLNR